MPNQNSSTTVTIVAHYRAQLSYSLMSSSIVMNPNLTFAQARASLSLGNDATVGPTHALQPGSVSELELWSLIKMERDLAGSRRSLQKTADPDALASWLKQTYPYYQLAETTTAKVFTFVAFVVEDGGTPWKCVAPGEGTFPTVWYPDGDLDRFVVGVARLDMLKLIRDRAVL